MRTASNQTNSPVQSVIKVRRSRSDVLMAVVVLSLLFIGVAFYLAYRGLAFFSCGILLILLPLMVTQLRFRRDEKPRLTLTETHIHLYHEGTVTLAEVEAFWPEYYRAVCIIVLQLKSGRRIRFQGSGLEMRCGDILLLIEQRVAHLRATVHDTLS